MCPTKAVSTAQGQHLVYVVTSPMTADYLMRGHLRYMHEQGWRVTIIASPGASLSRVAKRENVEVVAIPMRRQVAPLRDLLSLLRLVVCLWRLRPDIINYGTPKAGLLAAIAAKVCRVPIRIYTLRGLRCEGIQGIAYQVLRVVEKIASACSTHVICVSPSLRDKAIEIGAIPSKKSVVIGHGSSNGVDVSRFDRTPELDQRVDELRHQLSIRDGEVTIVFVGRIVRDKGIPELVQAFERIQNRYPATRLVLAGPRENSNGVPSPTWDVINANPRIDWLGETSDTPAVFALADIVALPTHREGFPNVALEAAAAGKPLVVSTATGAVDSIDDDVTGILFETGNVDELVAALERYRRAPELRAAHGSSGQAWVRKRFSSAVVCGQLHAMYLRVLKSKRQSKRGLRI